MESTSEEADPESAATASSLSPREERGGHGRPGDAAGARLLALLLLLLAAAAQAAQVDGETQQVEAQPGGRHAAQEYQGLWREDRKWERPRVIQETCYKTANRSKKEPL